jgi:capsular polysaccharide biosynthesis protein
LRNTAIGGALGLLLGTLLALALEMRRPLLRNETDIVELLGLPVLATLGSRKQGARPGLALAGRRVVAA